LKEFHCCGNQADWLEQSVKRQKPTKARIDVGQPTKKALSVRYAELQKLRQAVLQAESRAKPH
jgi:hypothetical protein